MKKATGTSLRPGRQVARRSVGSYLRIDRPIRCGRSFDIKIITMMRSGWEQTARRPRITRRWWAPPGTQDEEKPTTVIEFQIHQAINRQFYCRIVASNGEVLFTSETYHNKQDLVHAANVVRAYAAHAQILDYAA
jgi:uncharacterized protein YegP (UPF0339 family)